jgi:hypothetical protein
MTTRTGRDILAETFAIISCQYLVTKPPLTHISFYQVVKPLFISRILTYLAASKQRNAFVWKL